MANFGLICMEGVRTDTRLIDIFAWHFSVLGALVLAIKQDRTVDLLCRCNIIITAIIVSSCVTHFGSSS